MHSLLIDANRWGTHKIIQINHVLVVSSDHILSFSSIQFSSLMQAIKFLLLWTY